MSGIARIAAERERQIEEEGWSPEHDDHHKRSQLAWAAACYAAPLFVYDRIESSRGSVTFREAWPFGEEWDKRAGRHRDLAGTNVLYQEASGLVRTLRIRELTKAGALIAAEIDRLERLGAN